MISVDEALEKVLNRTNALEAVELPILDCLGRVLAEVVYSTIDVPPLDNSAVDGYAVRSQDTRGASSQFPRRLRVIDSVTPGSISRHEVQAGTAVRIMTGAPLPRGADAVVKFEDTDESQRKAVGQQPPAEIGILQEVAAGTDIRRAGEDITKGSLVLDKGVVLRPAEIGVLASLGRSKVKVIRSAVVAILATGDELVDINQPLLPGKIYNSNTYSIAAQVQCYGGTPKILGTATDAATSLIAQFRHGLEADMLITTGGVSVGDYDFVKDVLAKEGEILFWKVNLKPGRPLVFGMVKGIGKSIPHFGLPGNPVSAMVTFELFIRPALLKMMGRKNLVRPTIEAVFEDSLVNDDGRRFFARAIVEKRGHQYFARLTGPQGSGILTSMTLANGLVVVPETKTKVAKGDKVEVMMLDWNQEF